MYVYELGMPVLELDLLLRALLRNARHALRSGHPSLAHCGCASTRVLGGFKTSGPAHAPALDEPGPVATHDAVDNQLILADGSILTGRTRSMSGRRPRSCDLQLHVHTSSEVLKGMEEDPLEHGRVVFVLLHDDTYVLGHPRALREAYDRLHSHLSVVGPRPTAAEVKNFRSRRRSGRPREHPLS